MQTVCGISQSVIDLCRLLPVADPKHLCYLIGQLVAGCSFDNTEL